MEWIFFLSLQRIRVFFSPLFEIFCFDFDFERMKQISCVFFLCKNQQVIMNIEKF